MSLKIFFIILLFAFISACSEPRSELINPTASTMQWDKNATTPVIKAYTGPEIGVTYNVNYFIPEIQVWGDGRIIWVEDSNVFPRKVLSGQLSTNQMDSLLQLIIDSDFFDWSSRYGIGGSTHQPWHLTIITLGKQKDVVAYSNVAPEAYFELVGFLHSGAGAIGNEFVPSTGYLTTQCWQSEETEIQATFQWPDNTLEFTLDQVGDGQYIDGNALAFAWEAINNFPTAPVYVESNGHICTIMVQIPGISFYEPPS